MKTTNITPSFPTNLPDHTQLPDSDGTFVKNFQEHPQSILLTEAITPLLQTKHPDKQYCIGQDCGIYWKIAEPPEKGAVSPDWFYVPHVPPNLGGKIRRSYVLWQEMIPPLIAIEFVSANGSVERDKTPWTGKFWIYETVIRPAYYAIYQVQSAEIEVYTLVANQYQIIPPNERGHYAIAVMGVELGIWQGEFQNVTLPWLRWWDDCGNLLLIGDERAEIERQRAEQAERQLHLEQQRGERMAQKLQELGINLDDE